MFYHGKSDCGAVSFKITAMLYPVGNKLNKHGKIHLCYQKLYLSKLFIKKFNESMSDDTNRPIPENTITKINIMQMKLISNTLRMRALAVDFPFRPRPQAFYDS